MTAPAVHVRAVTKDYGPVAALRGVDLEIGRGEVFALLGPNGAGKTTLVEILEGYRHRSGGDVEVLGVDPEHADRRWRARIGLVLQSTAIFDVLTVRELITEFARFYPAPLDVARVTALVGLTGQERARCGRLSGGQRRRVDLALGLVGDPELIFLDEPTTGLDPQGRHQLWDVVRGFSAFGKTVVLTTHYLEEAEALASRVGIIVRGKLVATGAPHEIAARAGPVATVSFALPPSSPPLPDLPGDVSTQGQEVGVRTDEPTAVIRALDPWLRAQGLAELPGLRVARPSLEDVYLQLVESAGPDPSVSGT